MTIHSMPFATTAWKDQLAVKVPGEQGFALVRSAQAGEICIRMIEFTPGYRADHWCSKGHIVLVLSGSLVTVLKDGRVFETGAGCGFHVGDGDSYHRAETETGATVFIVD